MLDSERTYTAAELQAAVARAKTEGVAERAEAAAKECEGAVWWKDAEERILTLIPADIAAEQSQEILHCCGLPVTITNNVRRNISDHRRARPPGKLARRKRGWRS